LNYSGIRIGTYFDSIIMKQKHADDVKRESKDQNNLK